MDSKIKPSFWSDKAVEEMSPGQKLSLLWLFTAHVTGCGWVAVSQRRFEFETGSPWQDLLDAVKALGGGVVTHAKGFWIRNYIRHQIGDGATLKNNNMRFPVLRSMAGIPDEIRAEIATEYPELDSPTPPLYKPSTSTPPPQEGEDGKEGEERIGDGKEGVGGKPKPPESALSRGELESWIERIREAYPRKGSQQDCRYAIRTAIDAAHQTPEEILRDVESCAVWVKAAEERGTCGFVPTAKAFFCERQWTEPQKFEGIAINVKKAQKSTPTTTNPTKF